MHTQHCKDSKAATVSAEEEIDDEADNALPALKADLNMDSKATASVTYEEIDDEADDAHPALKADLNMDSYGYNS